jgi:uncharacterized membrane protein YgcG
MRAADTARVRLAEVVGALKLLGDAAREELALAGVSEMELLLAAAAAAVPWPTEMEAEKAALVSTSNVGRLAREALVALRTLDLALELKAAAAALEGGDGEEIAERLGRVKDAQSDLDAAREPDRRGPARVCDFTAEVIAEVSKRASGERRMVPVPWPDLEALYDGGLRPGVHVLTGGTGTGKTGWALAVALEAAQNGCPVLYAGLELDRVSVVARLVAQLRGYDERQKGWAAMDWPRGDGAEAARNQLAAGAAGLAGLPLYVAEPPAMGWSVDDLERELKHVRGREAKALTEGFPILVVVDFLQLVGPGIGTDGRMHPDDREIRGRIRRAAYTVRQLTRQHDVCALLVSAIARAVYEEVLLDPEQAPPAPDALVGMGKESGEIEYAAHTVTCLARTRGTADVWAVVAKNRTGRTGYVALDFHGPQGRHHEANKDRRDKAARMNLGLPMASTGSGAAEVEPKQKKRSGGSGGGGGGGSRGSSGGGGGGGSRGGSRGTEPPPIDYGDI